ncbi:MAG: hypothetical protein HY716_04455 [Planctomycetes bacterium]|nr:hypothetical protein [Planctomycetota bacterium]
MRTFGLALLLMAPQANDAEKLFQKMEQALLAAKTIQYTFVSSAEGTAVGKVETRGSLFIAEGNKARLEVHGTIGKKEYDLLLCSNGAQAKLNRDEKPAPPVPLPPQPIVEPPKNLTSNLLKAFARTGMSLAQEYADQAYRVAAERQFRQMMGENPGPPPEEIDIATQFQMQKFAMGKKETIGGRPAQAIEFEVKKVGHLTGLDTKVTVWIDGETSLPLKLTIVTQGGAVSSTMTERYDGMKVGEKIDDAKFRLPD